MMPKLRRARVDVSRHHLPSGRLLPVVRVLHGAAGPLCASNELRWQQRSVNFSEKKQKVHVLRFSPCVRRQRGARRPPASQRTTPPQPVDARRCVEVLRRCSLRLAPRGWRPRPAIARAALSREGARVRTREQARGLRGVRCAREPCWRGAQQPSLIGVVNGVPCPPQATAACARAARPRRGQPLSKCSACGPSRRRWPRVRISGCGCVGMYRSPSAQACAPGRTQPVGRCGGRG